MPPLLGPTNHNSVASLIDSLKAVRTSSKRSRDLGSITTTRFAVAGTWGQGPRCSAGIKAKSECKNKALLGKFTKLGSSASTTKIFLSARVSSWRQSIAVVFSILCYLEKMKHYSNLFSTKLYWLQ